MPPSDIFWVIPISMCSNKLVSDINFFANLTLVQLVVSFTANNSANSEITTMLTRFKSMRSVREKGLKIQVPLSLRLVWNLQILQG